MIHDSYWSQRALWIERNWFLFLHSTHRDEWMGRKHAADDWEHNQGRAALNLHIGLEKLRHNRR